MRPGQEAEEAGRDQQRGRNREERVVRERGGEVRDVVLVRALERPLQDCEVVASRELGPPRIFEPALVVLGLWLGRFVRQRALLRPLVWLRELHAGWLPAGKTG